MKIEIVERDCDDDTTSFDLVVDGEIIVKDTGIADCCEYLLSHYGQLSLKSDTQKESKSKVEVKHGK